MSITWRNMIKPSHPRMWQDHTLLLQTMFTHQNGGVVDQGFAGVFEHSPIYRENVGYRQADLVDTTNEVTRVDTSIDPQTGEITLDVHGAGGEHAVVAFRR